MNRGHSGAWSKNFWSSHQRNQPPGKSNDPSWGAPAPQIPQTWRLRRQHAGRKWGSLLAPGAPGPGGLGGRIPPRKAGGSGGREPPRKASPPELCYLVPLVPPPRHRYDVSVSGGASYSVERIRGSVSTWSRAPNTITRESISSGVTTPGKLTTWNIRLIPPGGLPPPRPPGPLWPSGGKGAEPPGVWGVRAPQER